jgi:16S rRNA (cytidine1402-2'-O)-methyltransferase
MPGTLFVVATPIGNLEDITLRALRVLREVKLIAAEDTRRTAHLLARHAIATPTTSFHAHNEQRKTAQLLSRLQHGDDIALVSDAGTPTIADPGGPLIRAALAAAIPVVPIPGPSAILAALTASGVDGVDFTFLGFPPTRSKARNMWVRRLARVEGTAVFFEAPHRIRQTLTELLGVLGDREVFIGRELTKLHESSVKCQISRAIEGLEKPLGEFTVVINIGHIPDNDLVSEPEEVDSRRQVVSMVAKAHGLTANQLYRAIEDAKKSGKPPT